MNISDQLVMMKLSWSRLLAGISRCLKMSLCGFLPSIHRVFCVFRRVEADALFVNTPQ